MYGVRQPSAGPATNQYQTLPACRGATTALCHSDFPRCGLVSVVSPPRARANPLTVSWAASSARARPEERRVASRRLGGGMLGLRCVLCCHGVTVLCVDPVVTAPAAALSHQPRSSPARPATSLHSASVPASKTPSLIQTKLSHLTKRGRSIINKYLLLAKYRTQTQLVIY